MTNSHEIFENGLLKNWHVFSFGEIQTHDQNSQKIFLIPKIKMLSGNYYENCPMVFKEHGHWPTIILIQWWKSPLGFLSRHH
jgi:hypothetical protein